MQATTTVSYSIPGTEGCVHTARKEQRANTDDRMERERERRGGLSECGRGFHRLIDMCQACRMHHCLVANTPTGLCVIVPSS